MRRGTRELPIGRRASWATLIANARSLRGSILQEGLGRIPICIEQLRRIAKGKWHHGMEKKRGKGLVMLPGFEGWDRALVQKGFEFREALDNMRE